MSAAEKMPQYFGEAEAARRLNMKKSALMTERAAGRIAYHRLGARCIRYSEADLDAYRKQQPEDFSAIVGLALAKRTPLFSGTGVYLLWKGEEVVYVGRTATFHTRLASHVLRKDFDSYAYLPVPEDQVGAVEAGLIRHLRPIYNVQFVERRDE